jgi:arsenite transporter
VGKKSRISLRNFYEISIAIPYQHSHMATLHSHTDPISKTSSPLPHADIEKVPTGDGSLDDNLGEESKSSAFKSLGWLDRFLAVWIFLAMAIGIILGNFVPSTGPTLQRGEFVGVSVPIGKYSFPRCVVEGEDGEMDEISVLMFMVAVGLLVMMYPILCKVRYESLHLVLREKTIWKQILFSVVVNWIIAPLLMVSKASRCKRGYNVDNRYSLL